MGSQAGTNYSSIGSGAVTLLNSTFDNVSGENLLFANDFKLGATYPYSEYPLAGTAGGTFDTSGGDLTITGRLIDQWQYGSLAVTGGGTVTLTNIGNTYSGGTTILAGTLQL